MPLGETIVPVEVGSPGVRVLVGVLEATLVNVEVGLPVEQRGVEEVALVVVRVSSMSRDMNIRYHTY